MSLMRRIRGARVSLAKHTLFLFLAGFIKNSIRNDILYIKRYFGKRFILIKECNF